MYRQSKNGGCCAMSENSVPIRMIAAPIRSSASAVPEGEQAARREHGVVEYP
ncbi:MAG: hypothetical protein WDN31_02400 [Hyphomicrobium sp.]